MSNISKYKVLRGGHEVKTSAAVKQLLIQKTLDVRANYCERSLSASFKVEPEEIVEDVEKLAKDFLMDKLTTQFGNNHGIVLDDDLTDIIPKPPSKTTVWGLLPKETTFVFWPAGDVGQDNPLNTNYKKGMQTQLLQEEGGRGSKTEVGRGNPSGLPNNEMMNIINKLQQTVARLESLGESKEKRHEKEMAEMRGKLDRFSEELDRVNGELVEQRHINSEQERTNSKLIATETENRRSISSLGSTVTKTQQTLRWLLYRYLLDSVRELVAKELCVDSWFDIDQAQRVTMVSKALTALVGKNPVRLSIQLNVDVISSFLNNDQSAVRQQGNAMAHSGTQDDIKEAIQMMPPDQTNRKILTACYAILFGVNDI